MAVVHKKTPGEKDLFFRRCNRGFYFLVMNHWLNSVTAQKFSNEEFLNFDRTFESVLKYTMHLFSQSPTEMSETPPGRGSKCALNVMKSLIVVITSE